MNIDDFIKTSNRVSVFKGDWDLVVYKDGSAYLSNPSPLTSDTLKYPANFIDFNEYISTVKNDVLLINPKILDEKLTTIIFTKPNGERNIIQVKNNSLYSNYYKKCILETTNSNHDSLNKLLDAFPIKGLENIRFGARNDKITTQATNSVAPTDTSKPKSTDLSNASPKAAILNQSEKPPTNTESSYHLQSYSLILLIFIIVTILVLMKIKKGQDHR